MTEIENQKTATVIGAGQMGSTLAKLLLKNGYKVTVWNRTRPKADLLVKEGAIVAASVSAAVAASPVIVVCVHDYQASKIIFNDPAVKSAGKGKTIIQLTTGSPADAKENEAWAHEAGAYYIDGAIQVAPDQMARPDTTIFVSGAEEAYTLSKKVLHVFGGNIKYLGSRVSAAAAMDLASLSYLYGALLGFFHAVRICEKEGFSLNILGEIIAEIAPGYSEFIKYEAGVIQSGDFSITQSPLSISTEATERILKASKEYGINTEVPALAAKFFGEASKAGHASEELAALIKVFRNS